MGTKLELSSHKKGVWIAGALLGFVLLGASIAGAQQGFAPRGQEPVAAEGSPAGGLPAGEPSPQQMLAQSQGTLERMEAAANTIRRQLRDAREARDVVRSLCLDDKLSQMEVTRRSAADRVAGLEAALQSNSPERSRHEYAVAVALEERADALTVEANQCIGEETAAIGASELRVTVDPDIANMEPGLPTGVIVSTPPVLTSPTL